MALLAAGVVLHAHAASPRLDTGAEARAAYDEARTALASGHWDQAEILLERVLMLMPDHAEARIDFAALMARRGQVDLARELLSGLAQDPRTPAAHQKRLRELLAGMTRPPQVASAPGVSAAGQAGGSSGLLANGSLSSGRLGAAGRNGNAESPAAPRWRFEGQLGASTNPLARTSADGITLTLADGPVTLPLGTRPQAGAVAGAALQVLAPDRPGPASLGWTGADVTVQRLAYASREEAYRLSAWGEGPRWWGGGLRTGWLLSTQQGFDGQRRHQAAATAATARQRFTFALYQDPDLPDQGAWWRADHLLPSPWPGLVAQGSLELGRSLLKNQGYAKLAASVDVRLTPERRLHLQLSAQEDFRGYSPLLESNARRWLAGLNVVLEQQLEPVIGLPLAARLFHASRASNLALFKFQDAGLQLVWVRGW